MSGTKDISDLLTTDEAAAWLRIGTRTLRQMDKEDRGPARTYIGGRVLYSEAALRDFVRANTDREKRAAGDGKLALADMLEAELKAICRSDLAEIVAFLARTARLLAAVQKVGLNISGQFHF